MKTNIKWLLIAALMPMIIVMTVSQTTAQTQSTENLLVNPGFEEGHYNQNNIAEITVPNGWRMHWVDGVTFPGAYNDLVAHRPETVVWNISGAPPHEADVFWRDGIYTLKIFKAWAPVYAALSQDVAGLEPGRRYRLVAPIFIDIVSSYEDGKQPADRPDAGQVRLGAGPTGAAWRDETAIAYSGWWTGATVSPFYLDYPVFIYDFTATQANMTVWIEMRSTYPYPNNGFFVDTVGLYGLDEYDYSSGVAAATVDPNAPTATPFPTPTPRPDGTMVHVVQAGDTFWNIAIQYAPALGISPEEALDVIQERNNYPAFINAGQELLIATAVTSPAEAAAPESTEKEGSTNTEGDTKTTTEQPETASTNTDKPETTASTETETESSGEAEITPLEIAAVSQPPANEAPAADQEQPTTGTVCVSVFDDQSGDGVHDNGSEGVLTNAALTLSRGGSTIATYVSDGNNNQHCFENLEPDTYQIQFFPPADYRPTTQDNGWIAVSGGAMMPVAFGAKYEPGAVEIASVNNNDSSPDLVVAPETATEETPNEASEPAGFMDNMGTIIIGVAVFLVLLAGVGVVMLRRG